MSPAILNEKISRVAPAYRQELSDFIDFILYRQDRVSLAPANGVWSSHEEPSSNESSVQPDKRRRKRASLFGALKDENFFMAPDFDAPLDCFKDYM